MDDKLITLKNYENMVEAMFDLDILQQNGVECTINNEEAVDLLPMFGDLNDGLRILVFEKDLAQALSVLDDYAAASKTEVLEETPE